MKDHRRRARTLMHVAFVSAAMLVAPFAAANAFDWAPYREDSTIEILTDDEDGDRRETKIWIVVLDDAGFIRTNDSRWLANIRRGSPVLLRTRDVETPVTAEVIEDPLVYDRVEQAFKEKYGWVQKAMSVFRMSRPTVLKLSPRAE